MEVLYVHDFPFDRSTDNQHLPVFSVGMPRDYFNRFTPKGYADNRVTIYSRTRSTIEGPCLTKNRHEPVSLWPSCPTNYMQNLNPIRLYRLWKKIRTVDLVVLCYPAVHSIFILSILRLTSTPFIVEFNADEELFASKPLGNFIKGIIKRQARHDLNRAHGVTYVAEYLRRRFPTTSRTEVLSNVKVEHFTPSIERNQNNSDLLKIGIAGALTKRKGLDVALDAINEIRNRGFNVELHLAGGHPDFDIDGKIKSLDLTSIVIRHGILSREHIESFYNMVDIYIQPSRSEGLPRATIEAMAAGKPVLASDLPGFRELLPSEFIMSKYNFTCLADLIQDLIEDSDLFLESSQKNLQKAYEYSYDTLETKRESFYQSMFRSIEK